VDRSSTSPFALILPHQPQPILTFRLGSSHLYISPNNDNPSTPRRLGPPTRHPLPPWTKLPHMSSVNDNLPSPCRLGPNYPTSLLSTMIHLTLSPWIKFASTSIQVGPHPLLPLSFPYPQATQSVFVDSPGYLPPFLRITYSQYCVAHISTSPLHFFYPSFPPQSVTLTFINKPHFLVVSGHLTWPSFVHITIASRFPKGPRRSMALYFQLLSTVAFHLRSFSMPICSRTPPYVPFQCSYIAVPKFSLASTHITILSPR
jgi:hypothetical protein